MSLVKIKVNHLNLWMTKTSRSVLNFLLFFLIVLRYSLALFQEVLPKKKLRGLCDYVSDIIEIRSMKNKYTGENKGFAFVSFNTKDVAQKATEQLHSKDYKGGTLRCSLSETKCRLFIGDVPKNLTDDEVKNLIDDVGPGAKHLSI